jgi:hypothetical protein
MITKTKEKEDDVLFEIDGFRCIKGSIYRVIDKKDGDAPSGFVKAGVSRLPSDGVGDSNTFAFRDGLWDTGFYEASPCYRGLSDAEKKLRVTQVVSKVLRPFQKAKGGKNLLEQENEESLLKQMFHIYPDLVYHAEDPLQVLQLYGAIMSGGLAPQEMSKAAKYSAASYIVVDISKVRKEKDDINSAIMDAVSVFLTLYNTDKPKLDGVLTWLGLGKYPKDADITTMRSIFYETIKDSFQNCTMFVDLVGEVDNSSLTKEKIFIYNKLKNLPAKSKKLSIEPGKIYYDDVFVGVDLKHAAENISKNPELKEVKFDLAGVEG